MDFSQTGMPAVLLLVSQSERFREFMPIQPIPVFVFWESLRYSAVIRFAALSNNIMNPSVLNFEELEWEQLNEFAKQKEIVTERRQLRLLELSPGFHEPDWCLRSHIGFVIQGELEIEFEDGKELFTAGNGMNIERGRKHKASQTKGTVRLFLCLRPSRPVVLF